MSFICCSFRSKEEYNYDELWPCSPRKPASMRRNIFGRRRADKATTNPYSDRGLDKFDALMADLDKKRQKILTQKGAEDVALVKFIYTPSTSEFKPIVVKLRDRTKQHIMSPFTAHEMDPQKSKNVSNKDAEEEIAIKFDECKRKFGEWWKPWYCFPFSVLLILVILLFVGRSFAISVTCLCWYMVPIVNEIIQNSKARKDQYLKRSRRAGP